MDPRDFKPLAEHLCKVGTPAAHRSAISRAYYFAYNSAVSILGRHFHFPDNGESHGLLKLLLMNAADEGVVAAGRSINTLRFTRNQADYHLNVAVVEQRPKAEFCIQEAATAVAELSRAARDTARWQKIILAMAKTPGSKPIS